MNDIVISCKDLHTIIQLIENFVDDNKVTLKRVNNVWFARIKVK